MAVLCASLVVSCAGIEREEAGVVKEVFTSINGEPVVPKTASRIYLAAIKNWTGNGLLGGKAALKIKDAINADGRLAVVTEKDRADLLLEVTLIEYTIQNLEFDEIGHPVRKRMKVVAGAMMVNLSKKRMIFDDRSIQAFAEFSEYLPPIKSEQSVLDEVADILAKRVAATTVSGWHTQYLTPAEKGVR